MRIIEIAERSQQGTTRPFKCRGEDDEYYYVKGRSAGYLSLCREWVAGELARRWGLPIAPFSIVEVPAALVKGSLLEDAVDLGIGPAFGSRLISGASELRWDDVQGDEIPDDLRAKIFLFDWWIANPDRSLYPIAGNPNMLWAPSQRQLSLFDHNLAFSMEQMPKTLIEYGEQHVFGPRLLQQELAFQLDESSEAPLIEATAKLEVFWSEVSPVFGEIWDALPDEWTEGATGFNQDEIHSHLDRVTGDDFGGGEIEH